MAVGRLLQMIALAIALLSSATAAIKINVVNNLKTPFVFSGAGSNAPKTLRPHTNATMSIHADSAVLSLRKKGYYSGPALKFHYKQADGEITYNLDGLQGDPFKRECRRVIPSDKTCPRIKCAEGGTKCELSREHKDHKPMHTCGGTNEFTIVIGEPAKHHHHHPHHSTKTGQHHSTKTGQHHSTKTGQHHSTETGQHHSTKTGQHHSTKTGQHHSTKTGQHHSTKTGQHHSTKTDHHSTMTSQTSTSRIRDPINTGVATLSSARV